jgi:hypothetical protein
MGAANCRRTWRAWPSSAYDDRFVAATFAEGEPVEIRAYRGSRRASTTDEHVMAESLFSRVILLASAYNLHQLPTLDPYGPHELNAQQARRVAEEVSFIAAVVNDPLLAPDLAAIQRVADYCWKHAGESWLIIEGP